MYGLTQTLARVVYQLDLDNLPLEQLKQDNHHSHQGPIYRTSTSASDHKDWKTPRKFGDFKPKPPSSASPAHSRLPPSRSKRSPALRSAKMPASVDDSSSPQMLLTQQLRETDSRRQSTPTKPTQIPETPSFQSIANVETEEIGDLESVALLESSVLERKDEQTKVARTSSPRKHRGYQKLKLHEGDLPSDENVIENVHILSPTLESVKLLNNGGQEPDNNQVASSNMGAAADSVHLEGEERRRSQGDEGDRHSDDLIISNSDAVIGGEDAHSLDHSPFPTKDNEEDLHSRSLANVVPASRRARPLRRSQSENLSLFRLASSDSQANLQQRSKSPDIINRTYRPLSISSKLSPLDTFSEFVPEVKSNVSSLGSGGQMTPPTCSTPIVKASALREVQDTPSTIYEEGEVALQLVQFNAAHV